MAFKKYWFMLSVFTAVLFATVMAYGSGVTKDPNDQLQIGRGSGVDPVDIIADVGDGSANPRMRVDKLDKKWLFSNDGTNFTEVGAGGGGSAGINLLEFADAETGNTNGWTADATSFIADSTSGTLGFGEFTYNFNSGSGSHFAQSQIEDVPLGLRGASCLLRFFYSATDSEIRAKVLDNSSNLLASIDPLPATGGVAGTYREASVSFRCPSDGSTVRVRFEPNVGGDADPFYFDNVHLGENFLVGRSTPGMELIGEARFPATTSCVWSTTSATFAAFGATAACPDLTVNSNPGPGTIVAAGHADLPRMQVTDLPAGRYLLVAQTQVGNAAGGVACLILREDSLSLNADTGRVCTSGVAAGVHQPMSISGIFNFSSAGTRNFQLNGSASTGTTTIFNDASLQDTSFALYKIPTSEQTAIRPDESGWFIHARLGDANSALSTTAVSETAITNAGWTLSAQPGSAYVEVPCSSGSPTGTTCSVGTEHAGIAFTPPTAGKYEVCAHFSVEADNASGVSFITSYSLHETSSSGGFSSLFAGEPGTTRKNLSGTAAMATIESYEMCHVFDFASVSKKVVQLVYEVVGTGTAHNLLADTSATEAGRQLYFTVYPVSRDVTTPTIVESVSIPERDVFRMVTAYISNSGTPVLNRQVGDWVSSLVDNAQGDTTININAGVFRNLGSSPDIFCTCTVHGGPQVCAVNGSSNHTSINNVLTRVTSTEAAVDRDFVITCIGRRP